MHLSFIVPALNEAHHISRCVESIRLYVPKELAYEVRVGDHGSTDSTADLALAGGATVFAIEPCTVGELRNRVIKESTGQVLVMLDADCQLTADWSTHILGVFRQLSELPAQVTGSRCSVPPGNNIFLRYWFEPLSRVQPDYLGTGHLIVARETFDRIGGFDPLLKSGEDYDFCVRAKAADIAVVPRPGLKVIHDGFPTTACGFLKREAWHGTGDRQSLAKLVRSRIALASAAFGLLQLFMLVTLLLAPKWSMFGLAATALLLFAASIARFGFLGLKGQVANASILYLYFLGRFLSLLPFRFHRARQ